MFVKSLTVYSQLYPAKAANTMIATSFWILVSLVKRIKPALINKYVRAPKIPPRKGALARETEQL